MNCEACGHSNIDGARFCAKCGALMPVEQEGPDPLVGQLVGGRYRVSGVLGEGGMGKVYVGEQQMGSTVRKVAIKTLHTHLSKDPSVLQRFHRECGTVAQLEHPNTIKFFDFGATPDGTLYIAMEFVAGKPLADVLKEGPLSPERVITIMRQVCGALDEAHLQGIVHRDLKPDNIILTTRAGERDFVKVLDFGIAARRESADAQKEQKLTQQGMVLGTPPYMSPEQFTGKELDARSDIYSLGVMAYEMLAGKLPFEADTPWQWATQHMTAQPTPFEVAAPSANIPQGMRAAIMKALSKDREQREPSAREFFAELSGGARMTVTGDGQNPAQAKHSDTAAMLAAPDFSGPPPEFPSGPGANARAGVAPTAPGFAAAPPPHVPHHAPGTGPAVVAAVPAPPAHGKKGGGKGLILGLGGAAVVLLAAIGVIAARGFKKDVEPTGPIVIETSTPATSSPSFGPLVPQPTAEVTTPTPSGADAAPPNTAGTKPTTGQTSKPPAPSATTTTTATATSTGTPAGGGDACDACIAAARGGNVGAAAAKARTCTDAVKKQTCIDFAKKNAPDLATAAARNTNCPQAKAIIAAAKSMGADSARLNRALDQTSCRK